MGCRCSLYSTAPSSLAWFASYPLYLLPHTPITYHHSTKAFANRVKLSNLSFRGVGMTRRRTSLVGTMRPFPARLHPHRLPTSTAGAPHLPVPHLHLYPCLSGATLLACHWMPTFRLHTACCEAVFGANASPRCRRGQRNVPPLAFVGRRAPPAATIRGKRPMTRT